MAETQNAKSKIIGLLEVRKHRGLTGQNAINQWITDALEVLLEAELQRLAHQEQSK